MTFSEAFRATILADSTLVNKVKKVAPDVVPEDLDMTGFPAMDFKRISGVAQATQQSTMGVNSVRIQVTVWDTDLANAERIINRVMIVFDQFNGHLGGNGGVRFACGGFNGPRSVYSRESRMRAMQVDILGLLDEATIS